VNDDMDTTPAPQAPVPARRRRPLLGVVLPAVLVLGAIGGGIGYVRVTVDAADRTAPTTVWKDTDRKPGIDPAEHADRGRTDNELSRQLLPVPDNYRLGPDADEFGNDSLFSEAQASALLKSTADGLSGEARRSAEKKLDALGVKGVAERVYLLDSDDLVVDVTVARMAGPTAARSWYEGVSHLFPGGRRGPGIEGHRDATCQFPQKTEAKLDVIICTAHTGDLTIQVSGVGPKPFKTSDVADLVDEQLDHIASPGKSI
jgi:hypothetical protein